MFKITKLLVILSLLISINSFSQDWADVDKVTAIINTVSHRSAGDEFGGKINSVDMDGEYAIVGAPNEQHDENLSNSLVGAGAAYILKYEGKGSWVIEQKLVAKQVEIQMTDLVHLLLFMQVVA